MAVSACNDFSLVVAEDGTLFAFGKNDKGQLVGGTPVGLPHDPKPRPIDRCTWFGGQAIHMVSGKNNHCACVTTNGSVYTWGEFRFGALAMDPLDPIVQGTLKTHCIPRVSYGNVPALMVACGCNFTMLLTATGCVWTCGFGGKGQLGIGLREHYYSSHVLELLDTDDFRKTPVTFISAGGNHAMALQEGDGSLWAWGCNI